MFKCKHFIKFIIVVIFANAASQRQWYWNDAVLLVLIVIYSEEGKQFSYLFSRQAKVKQKWQISNLWNVTVALPNKGEI